MSGLFDQITNYSPPLLTAGQVNYKGTWSAAANSPTLVSPPASTSKGDYYVVSAAGTQFGIDFAVGDWIISNGTAWEKVDLTDAVSSVFGRTGAITAASGDYTASQVTNVPAGTISSTNVQDAINELSSDITTAQNVLDAYVTNDEAVAITKGQVVYAYGSTGNRMSVKLANNSSESTSSKTIGVVLDASIAAGTPGYIRIAGVVDGLNLGSFTAGQTVYLGATAGTVTATKPYAPNHLVYVGIVERANAGNGQLYVKVQNGYELDEIHDVQITSAPASGALLVRDATNSLWKAARLTAGTNIAVTNADASVTVGVTGVIAGTNGGTGVNNGSNTITIAGNVTHAGAFTQSFTATANTAVTLPTTGTLATLAGSEALSNKTITASAFNGTVGATTASTGAFTTLSASGTTTIGTNAAAGRLIINGPSTASTGATLTGQFAGTDKFIIGTQNAIYGGTSANLIIRSISDNVLIGAAGTEMATFSSTGLAVTGTLSATGTFRATNGNIYTYGESGDATTGILYFNSAANNYIYGSASQLSFATAGTQRALISSTGLAVTGLITATGQYQFNGNRFLDSASTELRVGDILNNYTTVGLYSQGGASITLKGSNVGIGVTPSSWSGFTGLDVNTYGGLFAYTNTVGIAANAYFNAGWKYKQTAASSYYETAGGAHTWYRAASGTAGNAISFTQAMTLNANGDIGVGTTTPKDYKQYGFGQTIEASGGNGGSLLATNSTQSVIAVLTCNSSLGVGALKTNTNHPLAFYTNDTERARITSAGLFTVGTGNTGAGIINSNFNGSTQDGIEAGDTVDASGAQFFVCRNSAGTAIGSIQRVTTTNGVVYNITSDGRLKENLRDFTDSGRLIDSLKPRMFDWKNSDENGKNVIGFIAQEEHAADPIFAHIGAVSVGDEDSDTITKQWQRSDSALIPILVAELKALRQRVAALESN